MGPETIDSGSPFGSVGTYEKTSREFAGKMTSAE